MKQNKKQIVKLTESQFKGIITKSVKKVMKQLMNGIILLKMHVIMQMKSKTVFMIIN